MSEAEGRYLLSTYDPHEHFIDAFDCGELSLNTWLEKTAAKDQDSHLCRVHVACSPGSTDVLGFFALSNHTIKGGDLPKRMRGGAHGGVERSIPALLLGKFAVDISQQGKGLGAYMMRAVFSNASDVAERSGLTVLTLDVREESLLTYYQRYGFVRLGQRPSMAITLGEIECRLEDGLTD